MKNNKLIAEFMGYHTSGDQFKDENGFWDDFAWHRSWDSLMPVVEKIESDGLDPHEMIDGALRRNKQKKWRSIEDLYNVAVYLINIYNNE